MDKSMHADALYHIVYGNESSFSSLVLFVI